MGIPILLLLIVFGFGNARRAQQRGLKPAPWVLFTVLAFLAGTFLSIFLLVIIIMAKNPAMIEIAKMNDANKMAAYLEPQLSANIFLYSMLIFAGGFGGYLLVRYRLERKS